MSISKEMREQVIANRLRRRRKQEEDRSLTRLRDVISILEQPQPQHQALVEENHVLLLEQRRLLELLIERD